MGYNSYNAYYLGVQIGIGRVFASLNNNHAWTSIKYAKQNAMALHSADLLSSNNLALLTQINQFDSSGEESDLLGPVSLHATLVGITENFGLMITPYGNIYHFGFWVGIAEAQASTRKPDSIPHKKAALRKAREYAALLQKDYGISPNNISINAEHRDLQRSRENWGEIFREHA